MSGSILSVFHDQGACKIQSKASFVSFIPKFEVFIPSFLACIYFHGGFCLRVLFTF